MNIEALKDDKYVVFLDFGEDINIVIFAVGMIVFMVLNLIKHNKIHALKKRIKELEDGKENN